MSLTRDAAIQLLSADPARTAVISDFDGTLAQIVDVPEAARPLPGAARVLADLAVRFGLVAVVSGRPAAFLADHLYPPAGSSGVLRLVGLYGLESVGEDGTVRVLPGAEPWRAVVAEASERASRDLGDPSAVERKGLTVTLHWRRSPSLESRVVAVAAQLSASTGLAAHPAKMSIELRPPLVVDKGTAVRQLVQGHGAACFLGDDVGDLPAFRALEDFAASGMIAVRVAVRTDESPPELLELADLVIEGPTGSLDLLQELAGGRS